MYEEGKNKMQEHTYSISEIREEITKLPEQFDQEPEAVTVTRHGKPVMAILPWELYESLVETLEVMSDAELVAAFRQGIQELAEGKGRPWEDVKKDLGL
jgi:prevent-host-death family protein